MLCHTDHALQISDPTYIFEAAYDDNFAATMVRAAVASSPPHTRHTRHMRCLPSPALLAAKRPRGGILGPMAPARDVTGTRR